MTLEIRITKRSMDYSTRKLEKWVGSFDLENGPVFSSGPTNSTAKITKRFADYTQKSAKSGVCLLWGSFDLENRSIFPSGPTSSIAKVLTDVHKKFQ
ncbi:hypothetical protein H5410_056445 [Solanum commersonii]|uniref:Uncharacterized protein n=1 Tax=Solanum commersonii TaxID=4109 RepID=A0A9J5WM65_SOLCO|nr:hypothetical protein H5410_056445 [Solanum commersonii]